MDTATFLAFLGTCFIVEITPGPNMGYLAILSIQKGKKAGFAAVAGVASGLLLVGLAAASGLALLIAQSPVLYEILRWTGILYLFWLAWEGWWPEKEDPADKASLLHSHHKYFKRGLLTNMLNPKAAVFYIAMLPGFIQSTDHIGAQFLFLTLVYVLVATLVHALVVLLASWARRFLSSPRQAMLVRRTLSILLALIAVWLGWTTHR